MPFNPQARDLRIRHKHSTNFLENGKALWADDIAPRCKLHSLQDRDRPSIRVEVNASRTASLLCTSGGQRTLILGIDDAVLVIVGLRRAVEVLKTVTILRQERRTIASVRHTVVIIVELRNPVAVLKPVDLDQASADIAEIVEPILAKPLSEISYGQVLIDIVRIGTRYEVRLPRELVLVAKQMLYFERYAKLMAPDWNILDDPELIGFLFESVHTERPAS